MWYSLSPIALLFVKMLELFFFFFPHIFLATPHTMQDLSSPIGIKFVPLALSVWNLSVLMV